MGSCSLRNRRPRALPLLAFTLRQLTGGSAKLAARATWTAMQMGLAYSLFFGLLCLFAPGLFMLGHAAGVDAAAFVEIRAMTILLLRFVAAYCMFDTLQIVFIGALNRGLLARCRPGWS